MIYTNPSSKRDKRDFFLGKVRFAIGEDGGCFAEMAAFFLLDAAVPLFRPALPFQQFTPAFVSVDSPPGMMVFKSLKSQADVRITWAREKARVTRTMDRFLPILMFRMKKAMACFIGMDYERGLMMLEDLVETEEVSSRLNFCGQERSEGLTGVGIERHASFDEIDTVMTNDIEEVRKHFPEGEAFCVHHNWEIVRKSMTCLFGVKVDKAPGTLPDGMGLITASEMDFYAVRHPGPYRYLSNGLSGGLMPGRVKRFKHWRKFPPFEIYENESKGDDAVVKICLPVN